MRLTRRFRTGPWRRVPWDRINGIVENVLRNWPRTEGVGPIPPIDVVETPETLEVRMDLAGMNAEDLDLSVDGDFLVVKGERKPEKEGAGRTWHRRERWTGRFCRPILLPAPVEPDEITAVEHAGTVTITMPKKAGAKARRVAVQVA